MRHGLVTNTKFSLNDKLCGLYRLNPTEENLKNVALASVHV